MKILETERLLLRHLEPGDLDSLYSFYADPEISQYIPDAPRSYAETQEELEWHMNGHPKHPELGLWATIRKQTGALIGRCGLLPWHINGRDEVEIAYLIDKAYWRQGLATEAAKAILTYGFVTLKLTRLICLIDERNPASIRVAEKIGMRFEKTGEDDYWPFLIYSIISAAGNAG